MPIGKKEVDTLLDRPMGCPHHLQASSWIAMVTSVGNVPIYVVGADVSIIATVTDTVEAATDPVASARA